MMHVSRLSKMRSICGFSFFGAALVLYISNVHVVTADDDNYKCSTIIYFSDDVKKLCPKLDKEVRLEVGDYVTKAAQTVFESIYHKCNDSIDRMCDEIPDIVVTSYVGGREHCKSELQDTVCEKQHNYFRSDLYYLCSYYAVIQKLIANTEKWDKDKEKDICHWFEPNRILCHMATKSLCDRLGESVLIRNHCQKALQQGICSDYV